MNRSLAKCAVFLILFGVISVGFSFGQRLTGKIVGSVLDQEGAPLPGVTVEISSPVLMGGVQSEVTSDKGSYRFLNLPPGIYTLVFSLKGFETVNRTNVRVSVGTTVTEDIVLKLAAIEESITVQAPAPLVDVTKSGMTTNFSKELLEQLPSGRFTFYDVIKQAPGLIMNTQDGDRIVAYGSNYESSDYQLDGVDIRNMDIGSGWQWVNPETFAEVETSGIGAPAEYGQFTGAVINVVTKSGGNRFEGSLSYYGQFQGLVADNNPEPGTYSYHRDKFLDASFNLGGPIVKDKVWFFGSYERVEDSYTAWLSDPEYPGPYIGDKAFLKISSQIGKKHRLVGSMYYEYFDIPDPITPYYTKEAIGTEAGHTPTWNLMYTWLINNSAFLDVKYGGWWSNDNYLPINSSLDTPPHYDGLTGVTSEALYWPWMYVVTKNQVNVNLSYFAEDFLAGDHDFKVGVQYSRGTAVNHGGYSGGRVYYDYSFEYYGYLYTYNYMYQQDVFSYGGLVNFIGVFADDSWQIGDRLTVNLGVRFDHSAGSIQPFPVYHGWEKTGEMTPNFPDLVKWNTVSPRIGLAFQLTSDKKTVLRASYGRYYEALLMSNWNWPGPNVTDWTKFQWDGAQWVEVDKVPGAMNYTLDRDLKNPYADQYSVGLDRELLPNFSIAATYIYKKQKNLIGWEDRGATYEQVEMWSPDNGQKYLVWNQTSGAETNDYWITQPSRFGETFDQTYQAVILALTKRYSNNWQLSASLTWSQMKGLNNTAHTMSQQAMIWYTQYFGQDPNDLINARGYLNHDRPWTFKLSASYALPWGFLVSANYLYQTGRPIPTFVRVYPDQAREVGRAILAEPRGSDRFPDWNVLDLRLEKTFQVYKKVNLSAMIDVFNVFNSNTIIGYPASNPPTVHPGYDLWSEAYHQADDIFFPRRAQIGIRLQF